MAGKLACIRCGEPQTRARVVIDRWRCLCGDCVFREEYGLEPISREPTFLQEAVSSIETLALFSADLYKR